MPPAPVTLDGGCICVWASDSLLLDILFQDLDTGTTGSCQEITVTPERIFPQLVFDLVMIVCTYRFRQLCLQAADDHRRRSSRWQLKQQMDVVLFPVAFEQFPAVLFCQQVRGICFHVFQDLRGDHPPAVFDHEHGMIDKPVHRVCTTVILFSHLSPFHL